MTDRGFRILGISHIGLAPKGDQVETARTFLHNILDLPLLGEELVASQKTNTIMLGSSSQPQAARLELLENQTGTTGPIADFLAKRGAGIHHIALRVDHIENALSYLQQQGVKLIDQTPRPGAHKTQIAFVHPHATGGILIELVQE